VKRRHQGQAGPYLPFANAYLFVRAVWLYAVYAMPWGELGSLVYSVRRGGADRRHIAVLNQRDASPGSTTRCTGCPANVVVDET
jgi:hypothetical protein